MAVINLGSINVDTVFQLPHFPVPGETLAADAISVGLGGKGLNQSVAIARAGGVVRHLGCVGEVGLVARIAAFGVDCAHVHVVDAPTGQAAIMVDAKGENSIVLAAGANSVVDAAMVETALAAVQPGDWALVQNETSAVGPFVRAAKAAGCKVAVSAAPFAAGVILPLLAHADLVCLNEIELAQLRGASAADLPYEVMLVVTLGARGARIEWRGEVIEVPARAVDVVDTTGAGDTFLGYFLATLDGGASARVALDRAVTASALQVTRLGAAEVIPRAAEVDAILAAGA